MIMSSDAILSAPPAAWRRTARRLHTAEAFEYPAVAAPASLADASGEPGAAGGGAAGAGMLPAPAEAAGAADTAAREQAFEQGRIAGQREAMSRMRAQTMAEMNAERAAIGMVVAGFARARAGYFLQVEGEVVRLALAIARRILHREAQMDPLLLRGAVRLALERLEANTQVRLRVPAGRGLLWSEAFAGGQGLAPGAAAPAVVEDPALGGEECVLETSLGETRCNLDDQLQEIEQGFFDVLAARGEILDTPVEPPRRVPSAAPASAPQEGTAQDRTA